MKEKELDKKLDTFTKTLVKEAGMHSPKKDFATNIIQEIEAYETSKLASSSYRPLISKKIWFALAVITMGMVVFIFLQAPTEEEGLLTKLGLTNIDFSMFADLTSGFAVSKTVVYSMVVLMAMLFLQVPILKNIFHKRWN